MAFNIRSHAKIPKPFTGNKSGENAISHFQAWSDYVRVVGFVAPNAGQPDDRVVNFCLSLADVAREWFSTLDPAITYANLEIAFKARFGKLPPIEVEMLQLTSAKKLPEETYQEYGSRITQSATRVGLANQALLFFKKGIDANVGQYIMSRDSQNVAEAVAAAESIDGYLKVTTPVSITQTTPEVHFALNSIQETQNESMKALKEAVESMQIMQENMLAFQERGRQNRSSTPYSSRSSSGNRSQRSTSSAEKAPTKKPFVRFQQNKAQKDDKCFVCGKKGHWARECRVLKQVRSIIASEGDDDDDPENDAEETLLPQ